MIPEEPAEQEVRASAVRRRHQAQGCQEDGPFEKEFVAIHRESLPLKGVVMLRITLAGSDIGRSVWGDVFSRVTAFHFPLFRSVNRSKVLHSSEGHETRSNGVHGANFASVGYSSNAGRVELVKI